MRNIRYILIAAHLVALGSCASSQDSSEPGSSTVGFTIDGPEQQSSKPRGAKAADRALDMTATQFPFVATVFLTSGAFTGSLGGRDGANQKCIEAARNGITVADNLRAQNWIAVLSVNAEILTSLQSTIRTLRNDLAKRSGPFFHESNWTTVFTDENGEVSPQGTLAAFWSGFYDNSSVQNSDCGGFTNDQSVFDYSASPEQVESSKGSLGTLRGPFTFFNRDIGTPANGCGALRHILCVSTPGA